MNKRSGAKPISDKDAAVELAGRIRSIVDASFAVHRAPFNELFSSSKSFQRRVLELLRPLKLATGRPKKPLTDEEWLQALESIVKSQQVFLQWSEREVIRFWLRDTNTRWRRAEGEKFRPETPEGKKEVRRIQDACKRAKKARRAAEGKQVL